MIAKLKEGYIKDAYFCETTNAEHYYPSTEVSVDYTAKICVDFSSANPSDIDVYSKEDYDTIYSYLKNLLSPQNSPVLEELTEEECSERLLNTFKYLKEGNMCRNVRGKYV